MRSARVIISHLFILLVSLITAALSAADTIHIAVASNFTTTMKTLITEFEKDSHHSIKASYGSSGKIYAQIKHGAPFELFFSADQTKPLALYNEGLSTSEPFTYALGALALMPRSGLSDTDLLNRLRLGHFNKLAIANPKLAPYGAAAMEVLANLDLVDLTQDKWVKGENIAQTYQFVRTGNADLGFVALSQVINRSTYWPVPTNLHQPIRQDAVLLKKSAEVKSTINEFILFLTSPKGHSIIQSHGYSLPNQQRTSAKKI